MSLVKINTGEKTTLLPLFMKVRTSRKEFAIKGTIRDQWVRENLIRMLHELF